MTGIEEVLETAIEVVRGLGVWVRDGVRWEELATTAVRWSGVETNGLCVLFWVQARDYVE